MKLSGILVPKRTAACIKEMYRRKEADRRIRLLGQKRMRMFAAAAIISLAAAIPVGVIDATSAAKPVKGLHRNEYGGGDRTVTLLAETEGAAEKIRVNVSERRYTDEELAAFSKKFDEVLWDTISGENTGPENVVSDLTLPRHIKGLPFEIEWTSDEPFLINGSGVINRERINEREDIGSGVKVCLCASLSYEDHKEDKYSYIVLRRSAGETDGIVSVIESSIKAGDESSRESDEQTLPDEIGGRRITFYETCVNKGPVIFVLGIAIAILIAAKKDDEIKKEAQVRRKQIEADHARMISQYALYHTAGMNPRAIWAEICRGYEDRLEQSPKNRRYAFDEMLVTKKMMDEGVGELAAYDDHAQRIGSIRYRSFISLIKQAVVKGGSGLNEMLYEETEKAQRERMANIRSESAEAQTKLLLPMFMMLVTVLVIVMVPAYAGLGV